ncbi:MAG: rRNA pseudouridine synthase [Eggerthellaceae bacterium]|nr:rRNA pseudouridine synthase [Eggerthellaceae bacterium]
MTESPRIVRLQKFLARSGVASRRACEELIVAGRVSVNGVVQSELGFKVDGEQDIVCLDGKRISLSDEKVVLMLHKPAGCLTTMDDPQHRPTVASLVPTDKYPGLYPIGRLDKDTTGLLLFTNDGELGEMLLHPRHHVKKQYFAYVDGVFDKECIERFKQGLSLNDGMTAPADVSVLRGKELAFAQKMLEAGALPKGKSPKKSSPGGQKTYLSITIREGRKRQIRRMCEHVGHPVLALHRQIMGNLDLGDLPRGSYRLLSDEETVALYKSAAE